MFAESRAAGSTPETWREHFGRFRRVTPWGALRMRLMPEWRMITKYAPRGARVLDAGCGTGDWAYLTTRSGRRVVGLDYSADIIGRVERHYPNQEWKLGDVRAIPFGDRQFDTVTSWGIIEHDASGPRAALREFRRVLVPGGVAIVSVPNDSALRRRLAAARATGSPSEFFQYFMTASELEEEVRAAGFDVIESGTLAWPSLELALPRASARIPQRIFYLASVLFPLIAFWWRRFDRMVYCVGRRPEDRP
jgi:SAM-dependent methyltransferase